MSCKGTPSTFWDSTSSNPTSCWRRMQTSNLCVTWGWFISCQESCSINSMSCCKGEEGNLIVVEFACTGRHFFQTLASFKLRVGSACEVRVNVPCQFVCTIHGEHRIKHCRSKYLHGLTCYGARCPFMAAHLMCMTCVDRYTGFGCIEHAWSTSRGKDSTAQLVAK